MKAIFSLMFFWIFCITFVHDAGAAIASTTYVDERVNTVEVQAATKNELKTLSESMPERFVTTTNDQQISGTKTYATSPIIPTPPLPE